MALDPLHALQAANRAALPLASAAFGTLLVAGATGALGAELLRRLAGSHRHAHTRVLAREPIRDGVRGVEACLTPPRTSTPIGQWPLTSAHTAIIAFDPPRLYHDRERALWVPEPADLPELARWLRACGVQTLAIVQPHDQGRLPEALKRGLASLDEQAVVAHGFERVILVRSARKPADAKLANPFERVAAWMLSIVRFMVPSSEQPVRASKVAELVDIALRIAPPGVHVAAPELVWQAAQGDMHAVARAWLQP
ncbi:MULTISPECIES: hypothetical protein [unclassified Variovorax]|uniref:hypothetical protein n=1 Tax=unclassified Variovorax TaxID=663243 RepID=UPI000D12E07B|nr:MULTISPECIES: hypothetical protein [unclassified Variovorax]AVQ83356.1 hypothetical protein C4F17_21675 [Variovorax sp. PMC12]QRY32325.1 hypothetical protein JVX96_03160 [Variovorax sp. PDNC026]